MLEIAEHATWSKETMDLFVERSLALVCQVVDREAGDNCIEGAQRFGQNGIEVMSENPDRRIRCEPPAEPVQHGLGEVESHCFCLRPRLLHQCEQATISAP